MYDTYYGLVSDIWLSSGSVGTKVRLLKERWHNPLDPSLHLCNFTLAIFINGAVKLSCPCVSSPAAKDFLVLYKFIPFRNIALKELILRCRFISLLSFTYLNIGSVREQTRPGRFVPMKQTRGTRRVQWRTLTPESHS